MKYKRQQNKEIKAMKKQTDRKTRKKSINNFL